MLSNDAECGGGGRSGMAVEVRKAGPFLKWAGGKTQLLGQYEPLFPARFRRYHEPFLGGGAVFFRLAPGLARLTDVNEELILTYAAVRDQAEELVGCLQVHPNSAEHYYRVRATDPATLSDIERAARMIFLNKTCYNGLHRVNRAGRFNVPYGRYARPNYTDAALIRAASAALQGADLAVADFGSCLREAAPGDFVYLDPPYHPVSSSSRFTSYARAPFGEAEQVRLAGVFQALAGTGALVMLSNSDTPLVRELYAGFRQTRVLARRAINCLGGLRGPVHELVVTSY